jgi:uncharacterized protein YdbL (DUF1318 family)
MSNSEDRPAQIQVQADAGVTRVFVGSGGKVADEPTQEEHQEQEFAKVHRGAIVFDADGNLTRQHERSEINTATADVYGHGGEILKTARTQHGTPARTLTPDTIVEAGGMSMRLEQAEQAGFVKRDEHGRYVETTAEERAEAMSRRSNAPAAADGVLSSPEFGNVNDMQPEPFAPEVEASLAKAVEPLGERASEILTPVMVELAIKAAEAGNLEINIEDVMSKTGLTRESAEAFTSQAVAALANQADAALEKLGVDPAEVVQWARETRPAQFKAALVAQVNARTLAGYRALAEAYLRDTVPTEDALRKGGFETMHHPTTGDLLVKIRGVWMNARAAARNGMI